MKESDQVSVCGLGEKMHRISKFRRLGAIVSAVVLVSLIAPTTLAARPKPAPDEPPPAPVYCDDLPPALPEAYTCIAEETIELVVATESEPGEVAPMLNPGVTDKWHWSRSATIYANVCDPSCHTVASVRETQKVTLNGRRSDSTMTMEDWISPPSGPIKAVLTNTCIKDNSWFTDSNCQAPRTVIQNTWTLFTITNTSNFFHASDDLYWWKYNRKFYIRDHPNPATPDGVWYAPEGVNGYVASSNFNCDQGFPATEVCRFN